METTEMIMAVRRYAERKMKPLPYHNIEHVGEVAHVAAEIGINERVGDEERFLLETAGWLHDIVFEVGAPDNEERSVETAAQLLGGLEYTEEQIQTAGGLILATKLPTSPKNKLERIICDSDLWNLGGFAFFEKGEALRRENGIEDGEEWLRRQYEFLKAHRYYTQTALITQMSGVETNLSILEEILRKNFKTSSVTGVVEYGTIEIPLSKARQGFDEAIEMLQPEGLRVVKRKDGLIRGYYLGGTISIYLDNKIDPSLRPDSCKLRGQTFIEALWTFSDCLNGEEYRNRKAQLELMFGKIATRIQG